jgi:hypothetical protein
MLIAVAALTCVYLSGLALAGDADGSANRYYTCRDAAMNMSAEERVQKAKAFKTSAIMDAYNMCVVAEVMRWIGDYDAERAYEAAIRMDAEEPGYELLYGEYLRNFRGADTPLFQRAASHMLAARAKVERKPSGLDSNLGKLIQHSLVNLYQTDGLPLFTPVTDLGDTSDGVVLRTKRPALFFGSVNEYANRTTDPNEIDDARNFTSEALFAESALRLDRPLTKDALRRIARKKPQFDTFNRIRYRPVENNIVGDLLSPVDVFMRYRTIEDAQITNFFEPGEFNNLDLLEFGVTLEKSFTLMPELDAFLRGSYKRIHRKGLVEFHPNESEGINHFEVNGALSHFFGPNKLTVTGVYVYEDIEVDVPTFPDRERQIAGATVSYLLATPATFESRFTNRGVNLFTGFLFDRDSFGGVNIDKWDYFAGISLRGFGFKKDKAAKTDKGNGKADNVWFSLQNAFDLTVQPTVFTSSVDNDSSQDNAQYRTNVVLLYRILDQEKIQDLPDPILGSVYPAFVHIAVPFRHDLAIDGPHDYDNWVIGVELSTKVFTNPKGFGPTFLASAGYKFQQFYHIDKTLHQLQIRLAMGF